MAAATKRAAHDLETRKRSDDVLQAEGLDFSSLLLSPAVLEGLTAAGFQRPSPIQLKAIPLGRCGLGAFRDRSVPVRFLHRGSGFWVLVVLLVDVYHIQRVCRCEEPQL